MLVMCKGTQEEEEEEDHLHHHRCSPLFYPSARSQSCTSCGCCVLMVILVLKANDGSAATDRRGACARAQCKAFTGKNASRVKITVHHPGKGNRIVKCWESREGRRHRVECRGSTGSISEPDQEFRAMVSFLLLLLEGKGERIDRNTSIGEPLFWVWRVWCKALHDSLYVD